MIFSTFFPRNSHKKGPSTGEFKKSFSTPLYKPSKKLLPGLCAFSVFPQMIGAMGAYFQADRRQLFCGVFWNGRGERCYLYLHRFAADEAGDGIKAVRQEQGICFLQPLSGLQRVVGIGANGDQRSAQLFVPIQKPAVFRHDPGGFVVFTSRACPRRIRALKSPSIHPAYRSKDTGWPSRSCI